MAVEGFILSILFILSKCLFLVAAGCAVKSVVEKLLGKVSL
jgi:hypothetical protein